MIIQLIQCKAERKTARLLWAESLSACSAESTVRVSAETSTRNSLIISAVGSLSFDSMAVNSGSEEVYKCRLVLEVQIYYCEL
mmetsp:Transcript_18841/g.31423  ORF Transcript_18841/g.31423 Transcript_18841/m.31423 type:complete len:83 (-) Transcript_18841:17-265(-)